MTLARRTRTLRSAIRSAVAALALAPGAAFAAGAGEPPSVAFYYAADPPWDELAAFDRVVVEAAFAPAPPRLAGDRTEIYAYVSLGEMQPARPYADDLPPEWRRGTNAAWGSWILDQAQPEWPRFFVERIVRPLWDAGYRAFFIDTLDAYHAFATTPEERAAQQAGTVRAIARLKRAFPEARLIVNRGFEVLPQIHRDIVAVAAESLYRGYDPAAREYREVPPGDRDWLLGQLARVRELGLDAIVLDYVAPADRALARETAARIRAAGFVPWVAEPTLAQLGVGAVEVMPRKVLALHDGGRGRMGLAAEPIARYAAMPLNYLGFVPEYRDFTTTGLPAGPLAGRYAAIVTWMREETPEYEQSIAPFLARAVSEGVRVVMLGGFGVPPGLALDAMLPVASRERTEAPDGVRIARRAAGVGFETEPLADRRGFFALEAKDADTWLAMEDARGTRMDAVAVTPWGGYALTPYHMLALPGGAGARWVIDPIAFFRRALGDPEHPVPDVTTAVGRRAMVVQIAGDGFARRADAPLVARSGGAQTLRFPFAGEILARDVLESYRVPSSLDIEPADLRQPPGDAPALRGELTALVARVNALPHVAESKGPMLASAPSAISRAEPSLTLVPALTRPLERGGEPLFPGPSDALLTGRWQGASFGYARAVESLDLTGHPRRLAPIGLDFSANSAARRASLDALRRVYTHSLAAEPHPITTMEYVRALDDFEHTVVARAAGGWLVRGPANARTLRLPPGAPAPDLAASTGIAGHVAAEEGRYLHAFGTEARVATGRRDLTGVKSGPTGGAEERSANRPYVETANGAIVEYRSDAEGIRIVMAGHVPLQFTLVGGEACEVGGAGGPLAPLERANGRLRFDLTPRSDLSRRDPTQRPFHGDRRATILCRG